MGESEPDRAVLEAVGLARTYTGGPADVKAVRAIDLRVEPGSVVVIRGRSGSGKTTLLNLLGGLDQPSAGTVRIDGSLLTGMDEATRSELRRTKIGFIFQSFGLIPMLTAEENVEVPLRLVRADPVERRTRAEELLGQVGLRSRLRHRPGELSGGEQQRVAIARALANRPQVLLADEPTGQLDTKTGREIVDLLTRLVRVQGIAAIIATHDDALVAVADRVLTLEDGQFANTTGERAGRSAEI